MEKEPSISSIKQGSEDPVGRGVQTEIKKELLVDPDAHLSVEERKKIVCFLQAMFIRFIQVNHH